MRNNNVSTYMRNNVILELIKLLITEDIFNVINYSYLLLIYSYYNIF